METLPTGPAYAEDDFFAPSADQRAVLLRELRESMSALHILHGMASKGEPLPRELLRNVFYMTDARNNDLCKLTGVELDTQAERDQRYAGIRAANERARELERQLGLTGTPEQTAAHLKVLADKLSKWWKCDGFGHIREVSFTQYGHVRAELSCHLFGDFRLTGSTTPVSDKENKNLWFQSMAARGFVLHKEEGERDPSVVDCDATRQALQMLISRALPSAKVTHTENHSSRDGTMHLKSVHVIVYELQDVHNVLPTSGFTSED